MLTGKDDGISKEVSLIIYQLMVVSLLYGACATYPNIVRAAGVVSKFNSKPTEAHVIAVKRTFRYVKGTDTLALKYTKSDALSLVRYSDRC